MQHDSTIMALFAIAVPMLVQLPKEVPATVASHVYVATEPGPTVVPGDSTCANCSEGYYFGEEAHWWHGSDGCNGANLTAGAGTLGGGEDPGCYTCDSPHCEDPSVPHYGDCPDQKCNGGGANLTVLLAMGATEEIRNLLREQPAWYGLDVERSAIQQYNCRGSVTTHVAVDADLMAAVLADPPTLDDSE